MLEKNSSDSLFFRNLWSVVLISLWNQNCLDVDGMLSKSPIFLSTMKGEREKIRIKSFICISYDPSALHSLDHARLKISFCVLNVPGGITLHQFPFLSCSQIIRLWSGSLIFCFCLRILEMSFRLFCNSNHLVHLR